MCNAWILVDSFFLAHRWKKECLATLNSTNYPLISKYIINVMNKRQLKQNIIAENGRCTFYSTDPINLYNALKKLLRPSWSYKNPFYKAKLTCMTEFILGSNLDDITDRTLSIDSQYNALSFSLFIKDQNVLSN